MKIVILGPVTTVNYFGGVASFNESLLPAFRGMGHETVLITMQKEELKYNELNILTLSKKKTLNFIKNLILILLLHL